MSTAVQARAGPSSEPTTVLDDTFEIVLHEDQDSLLDVTAIYSDDDVPSEIEDDRSSSPSPVHSLTDFVVSRDASPTPSAKSMQSLDASGTSNILRDLPEEEEEEEHRSLRVSQLPALAPAAESASSDSLALYPRAESPPPLLAQSPPNYPSPPAATTSSPLAPFRRSYVSPDQTISALQQHRRREEEVERVTSPVGPSKPQAPPMKSMSPFERVKQVSTPAPRAEQPKRQGIFLFFFRKIRNCPHEMQTGISFY